ncbi:DUF4097 family beta strand repeat-containing protein [Paenibacillus sp. sgz500958]|uniref:DUF4097 family beta strand repeat-containing protein n=1 Tax=Paenibacillus sp. sgz500958 TaxID=3242475 RepID=UPI0036D23C15
MGRWKIGSLTAAIGCIAVGVVIVLAQFDKISYDVLGFLWPALLIVFGLEMLTRLMIRSDAKTRVSGWAIVLIIVLIGASAGESMLSGGTVKSLLGNMELTPVSGNLEVKPEIRKVRISLPDGKVKVEGVAGSSVQYEGSLLVPGNTPEEAQRSLVKKWKAGIEGDTLVLEMEAEVNWLAGLHFGFNSQNPYLNVSVPGNLEVEIVTSNGSIEAMELNSGLSAVTSNGTMDLHDIAGGVEGHSSNGSLKARNIQGGIELVSSNGSITAEQIDGDVTAKSSNGKISADSAISGDWNFKTSNGKVELELPKNADAKIAAETSNGSFKGNVSWEKDGDDQANLVLGNGTHVVEISTSNGSVSVDTTD